MTLKQGKHGHKSSCKCANEQRGRRRRRIPTVAAATVSCRHRLTAISTRVAIVARLDHDGLLLLKCGYCCCLNDGRHDLLIIAIIIIIIIIIIGDRWRRRRCCHWLGERRRWFRAVIANGRWWKLDTAERLELGAPFVRFFGARWSVALELTQWHSDLLAVVALAVELDEVRRVRHLTVALERARGRLVVGEQLLLAAHLERDLGPQVVVQVANGARSPPPTDQAGDGRRLGNVVGYAERQLAEDARVERAERVAAQIDLAHVSVRMLQFGAFAVVAGAEGLVGEARHAIAAEVDLADGPSGGRVSLERVVVQLPEAALLLGQVEALEAHKVEEDARRYLPQLILGQVERLELREVHKGGRVEHADLVVLQIHALEVAQVGERVRVDLLEAIVLQIEVDERAGQQVAAVDGADDRLDVVGGHRELLEFAQAVQVGQLGHVVLAQREQAERGEWSERGAQLVGVHLAESAVAELELRESGAQRLERAHVELGQMRVVGQVEHAESLDRVKGVAVHERDVVLAQVEHVDDEAAQAVGGHLLQLVGGQVERVDLVGEGAAFLCRLLLLVDAQWKLGQFERRSLLVATRDVVGGQIDTFQRVVVGVVVGGGGDLLVVFAATAADEYACVAIYCIARLCYGCYVAICAGGCFLAGEL